MTRNEPPLGVFFVCLGNICRSPLAEAICIHKANERGLLDKLDIDSAGTGGWHEGERADPRTIAIAKQHGIKVPSRARKVRPSEDFDRFPVIIAMDHSNRENLIALGADPVAVRLMRSFDPAHANDSRAPEVPDPYYGGEDGFETVYQMLDAAVDGLLDQVTTS